MPDSVEGQAKHVFAPLVDELDVPRFKFLCLAFTRCGLNLLQLLANRFRLELFEVQANGLKELVLADLS